MLFEASCHSSTPAGVENMYPSSIDNKHRAWINELIFTPRGPQNAVDQLILAAFECAVSILREAGFPVKFVIEFNAFKDMGIGGILSKFIGRMNDPEIGGYEGYFLPETVATWYGSFYTDYMTYLDFAGRDSVLAAQVASPGTQVTIQFVAVALEQDEEQARANEQTLNEYLENRTIADIVEHFTKDENCAWLQASLPLRTSSRMNITVLQNLPEQIQQQEESQLANWTHTTDVYSNSLGMCSLGTDCEFARKACNRTGRGLILRSVLLSSDRSIHMPSLTPRLLSQAVCRTLMITSWVTMTRVWRTSTGLWMTTGTQSPSHLSSLRVMCRRFLP